jgi:tRNA (uracil-5-)-methyltransferase
MYSFSHKHFMMTVNTEAAEILYSTIGHWCSVSSNAVLLDICCGTGTIGLTMAKVINGVVNFQHYQFQNERKNVPQAGQ